MAVTPAETKCSPQNIKPKVKDITMADVIYKYLFFSSSIDTDLFPTTMKYTSNSKPATKNLLPANKIGGALSTPYFIAIHVVPQEMQNNANKIIFFILGFLK